MLTWNQTLERAAHALDGQRFAQLRAERVPSIDSTNSALLRRAQAGDCQPQVLWADSQSAGRGRMGRQWYGAAAPAPTSAQSSAAANPSPNPQQRSLSFSIGLALAPQDWSGLSLVVGLAAAEVLGNSIGLKWPNDLCIQQGTGYAKLGGILLETQALPPTCTAELAGRASQPARWLVIGLGLNLQGCPSLPAVQDATGAVALRAPAVDLCAALPAAQAQAHLADIENLCSRLVLAILQAVLRFERTGFAPFAPAFAQRDVLAGLPLVCHSEQGQGAAGLGLGVASDGSYRLRQADGQELHIHSAEISLRPALGADSL